LALVEKGMELLEQARDLIGRGETAGLMGLAAQGQEIEAEARDLDRLAAAIRRTHGLPPAAEAAVP
jgi:hypothetical protein